MCGLAGQFRLDGRPVQVERVQAAARRLAHRGPDDAQCFSDSIAALAFRRLSILDISGGRQPFLSEDGRWTLVFNGEIYNHPALKEEFESRGERYRTRSDAETILRLFMREGESAVKRLEGMFALAIYDAKKREIMLARDHMGVKPLYYHCDGQSISFASELRALSLLLPDLRPDPAAVVDYLGYGLVHAPRTILDSALKLPPGHLLRFNERGLVVERFWELPSRASMKARAEVSSSEAEAETERLLIASVRSQLLSDVPVGSFLSGGVDSSLITAIMARACKEKVRTFSIGFSGARAGLDESAHARAVARYLGTEHHELVLPASVLDDAAALSECLDEPVADSAILPTYLLARHAREQVKVVLTGEGADEIFGGYDRYKAAWLSEQVSALPSWSRGPAAALARCMGKGRVFQGLPYADLEHWARTSAHGDVEDFASVLSPAFAEACRRPDPFEWLKDFDEPHSLAAVQAFDLRTVLCDALLMKADKATMRASLEARVPFLDRRLVEYALGLPAGLKLKRFKGKHLLRRVAAKYLPKAIAFRRKHGFVVPWEEWVRSPRSAFIDDLLTDSGFQALGIFDMEALRSMRVQLRAGSQAVDAGLFYRIVVLGLWWKGLSSRHPGESRNLATA
ncbi:MAG: asparagine synthase (glutamine-hydrolyzing) [Elusimicrobiota bacterium]|jgi:asparagine synthase (glutamine-hydrolysing)